MSQAQKALSVLVVACLGLWGCARGAANGHASAERIRALENKIAKLEDDFRSVVANRDQLRKQLATAEQEQTRLGQEVEKLQAAVRERDDLRLQIVTRTNERDAVQSQFEQFRKGIRALLGQADAAAGVNPSSIASGAGE